MNALLQDLRYGLRMLAKNPGFTAVAVMTLALGIGANTAIFSVVHGVLLKPLPYEQPEELYTLWSHYPNFGRVATSGPDFVDFRDRSTLCQDMAAFYAPSMTLTAEGAAPERLRVAMVTEAFFRVLRAQPALGRSFSPEEIGPGGSQVAVLSYEAWQRHFNGDAGVVGRSVVLNGVPREIIGVAPRGLDYPRQAQFWLPLPLDLANMNRRSEFLSIIARARPGVTTEQAQAELTVISAQLREEYPQTNATITGLAVPLHEHIVGGIRLALLALWGAVGFVLLIVCANVANLLLGRAASREREMAVRVAIGARRTRLVRQLLTESLLLAFIGGAAGVLLAHWLLAALVALAPSTLPRLDQVAVEGSVLLFALGTTLLAGILFGLAPAWRVSRSDVNVSLKEGSQGAGHGRGTQRLRRALIVSEVALSLVLLAGAGLMIRSFQQLLAVDPGFRTDNILTFNVSLPARQYIENAQIVSFYDRLLERVQSLPGVESAAATSALFFLGTDYLTFEIAGRPQPPPGSGEDTQLRRVSADLHRVMGVPVVLGRGFTEGDGPAGPLVAVVNETFARRYLPEQDAVGRRVRLGGGENFHEIVGVIADVKQRGLERETYPEVQLPYTQDPATGMTLLLRSSLRPDALVSAARAEVQALDPALPIFGVQTMEAVVQESVAARRFQMFLFALFAVLALLLAAVGIYGVLSHAVAQRTPEIGVRMALGARPRDILAMVLSGGMRTVLLGIAIGLAGAVLLSRFLRTLLYGVAPHDPLTLAAVAITLAVVAALACYIPARRAARVDPVVALRSE